MNISQFSSQPTAWPSVRIAATALSLVTAVSYFVIALGFVPADYLSPPAPVMFVAGLAYLIGGVLILRVGRRLLTLGAVLNALVIIAFIATALTDNATVDLLTIMGKVPQIGLEFLLLWLVYSRAVPHEAA
jgi:hypothetical protein